MAYLLGIVAKLKDVMKNDGIRGKGPLLVIAAGAVVAGVTMTKLVINKLQAKSTTLPGPSMLSLLPLLFKSAEDKVAFILDCAEKYGDVFCLRTLTGKIIVVSNPKVYRNILKNRINTYSRTDFPPLLDLPNYGLAEGSEFSRLKRLTAWPLSERHVNAFLPLISKAINDMIGDIERRQLLDGYVEWNITSELPFLTFKMASIITLGGDKDTFTDDPFFNPELQETIVRFVRDTFHKQTSRFNFMYEDRLIWKVLFPETRRFHRQWNELRSLMEETLQRRLRYLEKNPSATTGVLGTAPNLTKDELLGVMHMYLAAGGDTISITATKTLENICSKPQIKERIKAEVADLGKEPETYEDILNLPYIEACMLESLRLRAPGPVLPIFALRDCELCGQHLRAGTRIIGCFQKVLIDDYENGSLFEPERWLNEDGKSVDRKKVREFVGFGYGPRQCPGQYFATRVIVMLIANIFRRLDDIKIKDDMTSLGPKFVSPVVLQPPEVTLCLKPKHTSGK
ncbi:hypothetical protein FOL47_009046 [Perkinsus chesapeaki]|uniref:Cytochrome P450 n=1 Tax=Perkinsus chesapeaki TaxID=330153 RepID=A0A7J6LAU3_PERCH|nr:hypothetical protein FOL47_009046 [Perkinsus chesapeaki]